MNSYESQGKTLEEAVQNAVVALNVSSKEDLEIKVLEEGSKGFLGIGARLFKILATKKIT